MPKLSDEIIAAITKAGFDVYMRDREKDTWCIYVDGPNLGYLQDGHRFIQINTVHVPNSTTGTGFGVHDWLTLADLTREKLQDGFAVAPQWAFQRDRESVRKWSGIEAYRKANSFNGDYKLIAKGEARTETRFVRARVRQQGANGAYETKDFETTIPLTGSHLEMTQHLIGAIRAQGFDVWAIVSHSAKRECL